MKPLKLLITTLLLMPTTYTLASEQQNTPSSNPNYNAALAKKLGADAYGMKSYVLVILKTGPNDKTITDLEQRSELFKGHFANMNRLAKASKLVLAGPLMDDKPKRGLLIFNVKTIEEAEALVKTDPAVQAGVFDYEMTKYYGSAALMQISEIHDSLQLEKIE
ncbi:YciI family protein [uncultured Paraglaciecola sp.]|uniref:YciI family protein n=1 Tax=uncultured Paraglaciecola sp. TaxID=1765024 RepID=UPI0030D78A15|tara:strand:- start:1248 stop:1736 length:489 start_codon:yes stop_codon:yes gene_type:complete